MSNFNREIVFYESHFIDFYKKQSLIVRKKIDWTLLILKQTKIVPEKFFKHLTNTNGIWEVRVSAGNGIFRIFCFFDNGNLIVLLSGFQKKTQKTPQKEIKRAERLKDQYYNQK
ncbi:type II toxin-antitoxin system RelE/ParE family toxin [Tenacibaculum finnmarkense genomovar ulcerans]|uniref:type II toxin-antitoxin system RelE/ParE family toxin n=1 Tax=Tenacibaculum finnmarkense TaxID=2781243 RepID=UPI00187B2579|nr:type II toxin-antitoxin system RelE/ParE family toxin [Tenacibaculum finnmarkense]MBE7644981.1 type II toxin-antitoxin system RelE/ParE family toxin [Tenacibaculum finnmarkense genomovar ulcerans]MCD8431661.1 type II toxin-antitoxin system RelE/ParE family toxin [Tenacibaculum finnmarkense genomovar ulcerans]MCD8445411.1 type II toxin-antitoxin system RelE/ParE family toxin [Tenacibaculum finnmarkense genomovar ulcerans]MCG8732977.1 type II toxin-antitoxin system RelE/ParE family toxin [Tena